MDYREDAGNIVGLDKKKAQNEWKQAQKETGRNQVTLTLMFTENSRYSDISGKIKKDLETTLPGLQIKIKMVELNETLERAFDHNLSIMAAELCRSVSVYRQRRDGTSQRRLPQSRISKQP